MAANDAFDTKNALPNDIAVVGLGLRFPGGANDATKLWSLLNDRKSAFTKVPSNRFNADSYYHASPSKLNTLNSNGAHFMQQDPAAFDAPFFGITAQEANAMDPAARMLLEVTFEAFENAGQKIEDVAGSETSCYVGCFTRDYHEMLYRDIESVPMYTGTGTGFSLLSNRVSWFYDLKGPSMTLDTACSSSLVGLHLACKGLQAKESNMAVVCGANVILSPDIALTLSNLRMLSMDGLSRSFAEGTTGYGRGEGIAAIILKRVEDARRDGDPIRAVIRGSGVNQDGHTKGITLPNSDAQAGLISRVYKTANLDPGMTGYFEAHGTGTAVGDPLELGAIARSISRTRESNNKLLVGSIKSNIGHLEGAAGLAGVIKCVLMLENDLVLPNIHFDIPNKRIPFEQWKIKIPTEAMAWPNRELRRASVNSFGYGGTNAHVIIDDSQSYLSLYHSSKKTVTNGGRSENMSPKHHLLVLSAKDEAALKRLRQSYHEYTRERAKHPADPTSGTEADLWKSFLYTVNCRRSNFPVKSFNVSSSLEDLSRQLADGGPAIRTSALSPRIGFVFTGQGAQWAQMGMELMQYSVFAISIRQADEYLTKVLNCTWSVVVELQKSTKETQIELAEFSQPLSTILQVALVDLLKSWNILPSGVVGHSSGEIAAAYALGAITKKDAWKISFLRGRLCSQWPSKAPHLQGAMMAVGLGPAEVEPYLLNVTQGKVVVACVNSPSSVTLSGDASGIDEISESLTAQNIFARKLRVQNAYHSHHMQMLAEEYETALWGMAVQEPASSTAPIMASSVTGSRILSTELGPRYWVQNLVSPVLFANAVQALFEQPKKGRRQVRAVEAAIDILVEIGPHAALKGPLRQILQAHGANNLPYVSFLRRGESGSLTALQAAGELACQGVKVDLMATNDISEQPSILTDLPRYPWNHSLTYWADTRISRARQTRASGRHDLFGAPTQDSDSLEPRWRNFLRISDMPWIRDHVVHNSILYPGSGILGMPIHALLELANADRAIESVGLKDVHIVKAVVVPDDQFGLEVFLRMRPQRRQHGVETAWWEFSICSNQDNDQIQEHAYGIGTLNYRSGSEVPSMSSSSLFRSEFETTYKEVQAKVVKSIAPKAFYNAAKSVGLAYGPMFQGLTEITAGQNVCLWKLQVPDTMSVMPAKVESPHLIHPTTLDIIFHSLFAAIGSGELSLEHAAVPIAIRSLTIAADLTSGVQTKLKGFSRVSKDAKRDLLADIYAAVEQDDHPSVVIEGLRCRELQGSQTQLSSETSMKAPIGQVIQKPDITMLDANQLSLYLKTFEDHGGDRCDSAIASVVEFIIHKTPSASILQIEGVSAALTSAVFQRVRVNTVGHEHFKVIKFVSTCSATVDDLAAMSQYSSPAVQFLHRENDAPYPAEDCTVDCIILDAKNVSSASWPQELKEIHRVAKPGAKLLLIGRSQTDSAQSGNALEFPLPLTSLYQDEAGPSLHIGTVNLSASEGIERDSCSVLLPDTASEEEEQLAKAFSGVQKDGDHRTNRIVKFADAAQLEGVPTVIVLLEYTNSFLKDISESDFTALKSIVLASKRLVWISRGDSPVMSAASGLLRSLQNENTSSEFCFLHLDVRADRDAGDVAKIIANVLSTRSLESEYIERNGVLCCSRWRPNLELSALAGAAQQPEFTRETMHLREATQGLTLQERKFDGRVERVFNNSALTAPTLGDDEIEVAVTSLLLSGTSNANNAWREGVGVVLAIGKSSVIPIGSKVSFMHLGHVSTIIRVSERHAHPLPEGLDQEAAINPVWSILFPTVHYSLCTLAQLDDTKSTLVQGGGTLLGRLAVSLSLSLGATVFASVQTEAEAVALQSIGLSADHILDASETLQSATIMRFIGSSGLDLVFNTNGTDEDISELWSCVAPRGTFVNATESDDTSSLSLSAKPFQAGARFEVVDVPSWLVNDFPRYQTICNAALQFLETNPSISMPKPPIFTTETIGPAFDSIAAGNRPAEAILHFRDDVVLPIFPEVKNTLQLRSDSTYILAGGLGGLGRGLARLMVNSGAKHLVFLSRSGRQSAAAQAILDEFTPRGVTIVIHSCDVSSPKDVQNVFRSLDEDTSLPPVRGIIQSAAVLRDAIFENMTYGQWVEAVRPKIHGTWNLHEASLSRPCAPAGLDFFVMLASISGFVGNRGQANYACGNSYQDALARYRRSLGLAATSVDLGLMQDIGLIAEQGGKSNLKDDTVVPLTAKDFELIFKLVLNNSERRDMPAQIVTGLPTGGILQRQGITSSPFYYRDARFGHMRDMGVDASQTLGEGDQDTPASIEEQIASAGSGGARVVILEALQARLATALRCPPEDIEVNKPLHAYGLDSLMAVEMRSWIEAKLKAKISLFEIMGGSSIQALGDKIAKASELVA